MTQERSAESERCRSSAASKSVIADRPCSTVDTNWANQKFVQPPLFFSKTKRWVYCGRKTTWIIHRKQSITHLRNRSPLYSIDPDRIQRWNPLSHLVDRKKEPVCSFHVQEHLLLWPPQHACQRYQPQCGVLGQQVHEGFVKPDSLMNHRCSDNCWNLVFGGWRVQDRLKKSSPQCLHRGGDRGHYSLSDVGNTG